jgi:CRISPR-associated protein Csm5
MSYNYTIYDVTVTALTPLHIGSGNMLLNDYDYALHGGYTWRIDENAWLDDQETDDPKLVEQLSRTPPAQLLKDGDFKPDSAYFRYRLAGKPRATGAGAQLQEIIKTVRDEAYLPGSSLKGAIRTAVAWYGWQQKNARPDTRNLGRNRKFAGQQMERDIMGRNPNHDLLRALHIGDSAPIGKDKFIVLNVQVITRGSLGSPIELEAIQPETSFKLTAKVDNQLFSQWAKKHRLQLGGNPAWLQNLPGIIQQHTTQRLQDELKWYTNRPGAGQTTGFYRQLVNLKVPSYGCLLQVGWGTGWEGKTFGSHLQADGRFMERIIKDYRLAKGRRQEGDPFPKSRRVTVSVTRDNQGRIHQQPAVPLGWAYVELKERK